MANAPTTSAAMFTPNSGQTARLPDSLDGTCISNWDEDLEDLGDQEDQEEREDIEGTQDDQDKHVKQDEARPEMNLLAHHAIKHPAHPANTTTSPIFYSSAQWTADGTTILTSSSDHTISSFVLPADLLHPNPAGRTLHPQATTKLPEPSQTLAPAPFFSLGESTSQTFLVGSRDHPLHLYHAFPPDLNSSAPLAQYKLIRHETEQYITPASLVWPSPGTHFICGSVNRLDYFDVSRHGSDGPVLTVPTIPSKRHIAKGHGVGIKGTVSALAVSPTDSQGGSLVAAGTRTRWMGLYDLHRADGAVANWQISQPDLPGPAGTASGQGIVQVVWSPCGRYLVINERRASGLLVYDIRGSGKLLAVLTGRLANTQQKLTCDVFQSQDPYRAGGFEVWSGAQDGSVMVWEDVGFKAAEHDPSWAWNAHSSPVCSTILHPSGSVAATCSGGWEHLKDEEQSGAGLRGLHLAQTYKVMEESSLKLWSLHNTNADSDEPI
ncbi:hypothetical protein E4U13_008418 [Claviceps humidiphila]|uniref:Guanine nucleotide-binding protein n=1 Tax=Claviceps humidiphila TaxID=1294629 RepID=A0A9P7Q5I2_9HYPO|nr:hypothetical protein E4U13_008418 [Claviceps humidiphila]